MDTAGCEHKLAYECAPCKEKQIYVESKLFCQDCFKFFCRKCHLKHDDLFEQHSVLDESMKEDWGLRGILQRCETHKSEEVLAFCKDHNELCCHKCVISTHRQCLDVRDITEIATDNDTAVEFHKLSKQIKSLLNELTFTQISQANDLKTITQSGHEAVQQISAFRKILNAQLDHLENITKLTTATILSEIKDEHTKQTNRISEIQRLFQSLLKELAKTQVFGTSVFAPLKKCRQIIETASVKMNNKEASKIVVFQPNTAIEKYLCEIQDLGESIKANLSITLSDQRLLELDIPDKEKCIITGIIELPSGELLLADQWKSRLTLLDNAYKPIQQYSLEALPWDICHIDDNIVAVAMHDMIQTVHVQPGAVTSRRKLQVRHQCTGIDHRGGYLYVASGTALYKYTTAGDLTKIVYENKLHTGTVCKVKVNADGTQLFVTGWGQNKILILNIDDHEASSITHHNIIGPSGIDLTSLGQLLLCDSVSHALILVDGNKITTLFQKTSSLINPRTICFAKSSKRLIVGQREGNKIYVFRVSVM
ncbi:uncharacterized protein LOC127845057 [Dreissena polymorpha]|uniref:B box-type domain-containing protein n=1 Tax=Dreissena polymorpha TaxID=45954 RepID=A0A9D4EFR8_DREPO|nr:uncharacterized protein LOC127845057 [Dreissena polymorpha]KAH3778498.1 hypothetical protein DPMN_179962 [Dreissena polymorpha]